RHMWHKSVSYLKKAGTVILAASVILWVLLSFPKPPEHLAKTEGKSDIEYSIAGRVGHFIEPSIRPAGFDWRIGISLFAGFAAKEVIVSTMGVVHGINGANPDIEGSVDTPAPLRQLIADDPSYSPAMALALMMFVMIYVPCLSVLAVVKKELGKWVYPAFQAAYTLIVAWGLSVVVYQTAKFFGLG
ncbi:nucleoside recognition domain-containing protein, partial [Calditrichota bacterium]